MYQLPWAICSTAEGNTIRSVNVCGMNNESFLESFLASVSAFSFHLSRGPSSGCYGMYRVYTEQAKALHLD